MADDILKDIPLPADLPENWTSGQIIAPTGAEAGLDEQHGYNYLMRQVNNAQKALKVLAAQREEDRAKIKFWVSPDPTSPASFIGGTWEQIKDCFILAAGDTYAAGSTGGEAEHKLTKGELPSHYHNLYVTTSDAEGPTVQAIKNWENQFELVTKYRETGVKPMSAVGDGIAHNNMPPYVAMYAWKRIA